MLRRNEVEISNPQEFKPTPIYPPNHPRQNHGMSPVLTATHPSVV